MNYWFISAGTLLFISLLIHMLAGDKEYRVINPKKQKPESDRLFEAWLMGRGTFQMVSVDLLLTSAALLLMGVNIIPYNYYLSIFITLLYAGYLVFWLLTLWVSKAKPANYLKQGQWVLFLTAFILIIMGI